MTLGILLKTEREMEKDRTEAERQSTNAYGMICYDA